MATGQLKLYYSSGTTADTAFNEPRRSIGGLLTETPLRSQMRNLFGPISMNMLGYGVVEYRAIYLRNMGTDVTVANDKITNLKAYFDVPLVATVTDPADLSPAPSNGDKWIVPAGAEGAWLVMDSVNNSINTVEGKMATYVSATSSWVFSYAPFAKYAMGTIRPVDAVMSATVTLHQAETPVIENAFVAPGGITFQSADSLANIITLDTGELIQKDNLVLWIRRTVPKFKFANADLVVDAGPVITDEAIPLVFKFDTP